MPRNKDIHIMEESYRYLGKPQKKREAMLKLRCTRKDLRLMREAAGREDKSVELWALEILILVANSRGWDLVTFVPYRPAKRKAGAKKPPTKPVKP